MSSVICECCYVMHGWIKSCNCKGGPTRTDKHNIFGVTEPWIDSSMGRNERFNDRREPATKAKDQHHD